MSTVTQRIPNLLLGISQQPDNRKFPGQVRDAVNTFPDYALGLLKRPGGQFETKLEGADTSGFWFPIIRDENEKYLCQIRDDGNVRIWDMLTGEPRRVHQPDQTIPTSCNSSGLTTKLNDLNTAKSFTQTKLTELHTAQANYVEILAGQNETEEALFEVQYDYDKPGEIEQTVKSGILLNAYGVYIVKNNNTVVSSTTTLPSDYALGTEFTNEYPLIASEGYRVYQAIKTNPAANTAGELATALTAMNTAQTNYDNAVSDQASKQTLYDNGLADCNISGWSVGNYLYGATADDIKTLTVNDYTFILNTKKVVEYTSSTTSAASGKGFFLLKVSGSGHYKIDINGTEVASYNAGTGTDADAILEALITDFASNPSYGATRIGDGLLILATNNQPFSMTATGAPGSESVFAFTNSVPNVASLPLQCSDGYKVKVVNTEDVTADDYYVTFEADNGSSGSGTWVETNGYEVPYAFNESTLPHLLIRMSNGHFVFVRNVETPYSAGGATVNIPGWADRLVGDEDTNPDPSFVGSTINNIFFYRNRLGFLTDENVVLSKAGDFFNLFAETALTVREDDPIDISASTTKAVKLGHVKPSSVGLVLFSDKEQFILNTDSDILSPKTAKINALSSYECDPEVPAVELGTSLAFLSKTPLYSRVYEIGGISTTNPPTMVEPTQYVPELVPSSVDTFISSPSLSLMSLGTEGESTIYQLRYAQQGDQRSATTWYKWQLTGDLMLQFFDISTYNALVSNGTNEVYLQSYDLSQDSETGYLTLPTGERTDVCLDLWSINPYRTYDSANDTTRIFLPYEKVSNGTFAVVVLGGYIDDQIDVTSASVGAVLYPTVTAASGSDYVDIDGDYRGRNLIIGYIYNMEVELPKFFVTQSDGRTAQSDFTSDLIIHRIKVSTGLSGPIKYQIGITGRPEWDQTIEAVQPNVYELNNVNLTAESVQNIPIYQRNDNLSVKVIGDTPMPVTLLNLTWEGRYNTGFYSRS